MGIAQNIPRAFELLCKNPNMKCFLAAWKLRYIKGNLLALLKQLETAHIDFGVMREQIFPAIVCSNKTKPHVIVKPFNCNSCHVISSLT